MAADGQANLPIGIFDSGVGGLTVVRAIRDLLPAEGILYFGDTARVPYGGKSPETVRRYALEIAHHLGTAGVKCLVVACNTASALALDVLREDVSLPVLGVVGPGASAAAVASRSGRIGVVATRATIASGAYQQAIARERPDATVITRACPLFVPLVEEMWLGDGVTFDVIARYLDPLMDEGIDTLVLGCTHYPFLRDAIAAHCGGGITIVDSADSCATEVEALVGKTSRSTAGPLDILLTDTPDRFLPLANDHLQLGIESGNIRAVSPEAISLLPPGGERESRF